MLNTALAHGEAIGIFIGRSKPPLMFAILQYYDRRNIIEEIKWKRMNNVPSVYGCALLWMRKIGPPISGRC